MLFSGGKQNESDEKKQDHMKGMATKLRDRRSPPALPQRPVEQLRKPPSLEELAAGGAIRPPPRPAAPALSREEQVVPVPRPVERPLQSPGGSQAAEPLDLPALPALPPRPP